MALRRVQEEHFKLIDEVNKLDISPERGIKMAELYGFTRACALCGQRLDFIEADLRTMEKYGDEADMVCGVLQKF